MTSCSRRPRPARALFVTAGSGVTPVMGMLRNHLDELQDVVVIHSAPTEADVIFAAELREWAEAGRIRLVERHTDTEGMVGTDSLDELVPDWRFRETWACGPPACSTPSRRPGPTPRSPTDSTPSASARSSSPRARVAPSPSARQRITVDADGSTPILDAGEAAGVLMPSGCRMGICFGCVVPLKEGAVRDLRNGDLTIAAKGDGIRIQTCVSAAAGHCEIDL